MSAIVYKKSPDRRIAKTRSALATSLFSLMQAHEWENISIQLLCDEANVARSSFYAHYDALADLLEEVMAANMPSFSEATKSGTELATLTWLVDHISGNKKLFRNTVHSPSGAVVLSRFKSAIRKTLAQELAAKQIILTDAHLSFVIGGTMEALQTWAMSWRMEQLPELKNNINFLAQAIIATTSKTIAII